MPTTRIIAPAFDFSAIGDELGLSVDFPSYALAEAEAALAAVTAAQDVPPTDPVWATVPWADRDDATGLALVSLDQAGAREIDQAFQVERTSAGFLLHVAVSDVAALVTPGGSLDTEARRRGQSVPLPGGSVPLHPAVLTERAASLLPDLLRPAVLWRIELDDDAQVVDSSVRRAVVRSVGSFSYDEVQRSVDGSAELHPSLAALPELGRLRQSAARDRGVIALRQPEQEVRELPGEHRWQLSVRRRSDVDDWKAELALLVGACAAAMMLEVGTGILRVVPEPAATTVARLRARARALGVTWPLEAPVGEVLANLDQAAPTTLVLERAAGALLAGATYAAFDGEPPAATTHYGLGVPYANVTAPLRRVVDRYATEVCLAASQGQPVPEWVREVLLSLPAVMDSSDAVVRQVDDSCVDLTTATVLASRVGESFPAVAVRSADEEEHGEVFIEQPPRLAACTGLLDPGTHVTAVLTTADPATRSVVFAQAEPV
ncbi:RNB domain-containing ribonuclease [Rhodococcus sp. X156]|uniref:RNB domain-containing ribonuclease n=1 Tax=Rhodococcus sp. X156 TaxID=2499145 RepID=UPI000FD8C3A6|nr:RNB domain-containing ribonuclease [Rhodococcus sp. X156]